MDPIQRMSASSTKSIKALRTTSRIRSLTNHPLKTVTRPEKPVVPSTLTEHAVGKPDSFAIISNVHCVSSAVKWRADNGFTAGMTQETDSEMSQSRVWIPYSPTHLPTGTLLSLRSPQRCPLRQAVRPWERETNVALSPLDSIWGIGDLDRNLSQGSEAEKSPQTAARCALRPRTPTKATTPAMTHVIAAKAMALP